MRKDIIIATIFGLLIGFFIAFNFTSPLTEKHRVQGAGTISPEIEDILATNNLDEQVVLYENLIGRIGLEEAQDALLYSGLPFTGETHLLNHTSGDFAYEEYGNKGLLYCKDYFLASCYHGAILNTIAIEGIEALKESMKYCWEKGIPVATQCAHAMGHGFIAWFGYENLTLALETCDKMQENDSRFPLFNCHDGVFMENLWGVHEDGTPSANRWIDYSDPYYPCTDPRIEEKWQPGCWSNQAHVMYQMFQGNIAKVVEMCDAVMNDSYKETCFDSLARQVHPITEGSVDRTFEYCSLFPGEWNQFCLVIIVKADFSVGGRKLSYEICERIIQPDNKNSCYGDLFGVIQTYHTNNIERSAQCNLVKDREYRKECYAIM